MLKLIPAILLLALLSSCNFSHKTDNSTSGNLASDTSAQNINPWLGFDTITINGKVCRLDSITQAEFDAIKENHPDTTLPPEIKESKEGLRITLKSCDSLFLQSVIHIDSATGVEMDDMQHYQFYGSYPGTDYWLVTIDYYESEGFMLVNKQNGKQATTIEFPVLSPNKNLFASAHFDQSLENANGIDLYKITADSLMPIFSVPAQSIEKIKWHDNSTLYLRQSTLDKNNQPIFRFAKLNLNEIGPQR